MKTQIKIIVFVISVTPFLLKGQVIDVSEKNKLTNLFSARTITAKGVSASPSFDYRSIRKNTDQTSFKNRFLFDKKDILHAALFDQSQCKITTEKPNLAFFCAMENKFRNRFNVYLKLRAGNDEVYRDLISTISSK
jgi:hypothetical protein